MKPSPLQREQPVSPVRELALAVIEQTLEDLRTYQSGLAGRAGRAGKRRVYAEAIRWVLSDDRSWPYSFLNLCDLLDLSSDAVRWQLLHGTRDAAKMTADWMRAANLACGPRLRLPAGSRRAETQSRRRA